MAYTPYYPGGWQSGEQGGTPITPAALNNMENGIRAALTEEDVVNNLTSTATDKPGSANMLRVLNDKFSTQINSNYLVMTGTLGGDVINRANIASNGITFYVNSNVPTNSPPNIGYGAYLFLKSGPTGVSIFCWDNSHFACCYGLNPLTATSISWNVVK
ncbi:MAG: hypothetical protein II008_16545 [Oscillospiraceae bacterium]|nr:hypothetical protein [Oscillospiraceae bacterium]